MSQSAICDLSNPEVSDEDELVAIDVVRHLARQVRLVALVELTELLVQFKHLTMQGCYFGMKSLDVCREVRFQEPRVVIELQNVAEQHPHLLVLAASQGGLVGNGLQTGLVKAEDNSHCQELSPGTLVTRKVLLELRSTCSILNHSRDHRKRYLLNKAGHAEWNQSLVHVHLSGLKGWMTAVCICHLLMVTTPLSNI